MKNHFYDTSSLILLADNLPTNFIISSITLAELEKIKSSYNKTEEVRQGARKILHFLNENPSTYTICIFENKMLDYLNDRDFEINNDLKILSSAIFYEKLYCPDDMIFYTNDLALKAIAHLYFGEDSIKSVEVEEDNYSGYLDITMRGDAMEKFYSNQDKNLYNLKPNQYLIVRDENKEIVDKLCWTGEGYRHISYGNFNSKWFGDVKPMSGDVYQALAADSLIHNKITMLKGPAGTGKTYLALGYLLHKLDKKKIDKIIIFCNTVATKSSAKLGFYPGTRDEKLLDSQIGNLLSSKLGDRVEVERMIQDGNLVLLPMSDIRGYDTSGMNAGIYISEAQNLDISLMKLALQRIGEDNICIIDGDPLTQVDDVSFAGVNNGMRRASKVFRGTEVYGEVELKNIHRSKIAKIAENM